MRDGGDVRLRRRGWRARETESSFTHLRTKKMVAGKYPARHFLSTQQASGEGELGDIFLLPGAENPVGGLTNVRSDMAPLLSISESGRFRPGFLRPLKGVNSRERKESGVIRKFRPCAWRLTAPMLIRSHLCVH